MTHPRAAALSLRALALALCSLASAQSVVATHSGVVYFFDGSVFIGDQPLEQKFGKFPDIGEGGQLRTERGRAEVLLTPGVFLRLDENSAIRMLSEQLSDTRVELVAGSAIVEAREIAADTAVTMIYKNWQVRIPREAVYRMDSQPPQLVVYKGEIQVSADDGAETVAVHEGDTLPLSGVLVSEPSAATDSDGFKTWAMSRSQAIAADNEIAANIVDDPSQVDMPDLAVGGFSYFPLTGIPALGITNPYGLSFWGPYQSAWSTMYNPTFLYGPLYRGWPTGTFYFSSYYSRPVSFPTRIGTGVRPGGFPSIRPFTPPSRTSPGSAAPHIPVIHGIHAGAHR